jgi:sulfofructose kinase
MPSCINFDILGIGCVAVDDIIFVNSYPPINIKIPVLRRKREIGGLTGRALLAASNLGAKCAYSAVLGINELSEYVFNEFKLAGIDVESVKKSNEAGPMHTVAIVAIEEPTRNTFFDATLWNNAILNFCISNDLIHSAQVLLIDNYIGIKSAIKATKIAREASIPVVGDIEDDDYDDFDQLLNLVDHLIISNDFALNISGCSSPGDAVEKLWDTDKEFIAVTNGENGCWYRCSGDSKIYHQSAFSVPEVDTTGCGDVFHGAYALALAKGLPTRDRVKIASASAALKAKGEILSKKTLELLLGETLI